MTLRHRLQTVLAIALVSCLLAPPITAVADQRSDRSTSHHSEWRGDRDDHDPHDRDQDRYDRGWDDRGHGQDHKDKWSKRPPHRRPKGPKGRCRDFARPCEADLTDLPGLPETTTSYTTATSSSGVSSAIPKWFYLYSALGTEEQPLVLTDNSPEGQFGDQLTIEAIEAGNRGQLWKAEPLGTGFAFIHSGRGNALRLSYGGGSANNKSIDCNSQWAATNYPSQVNSPTTWNSPAIQQWSYSTVATTTIGGETVPLVVLGNANCTSPSAGQLFVFDNQAAVGATVDMGVFGSAPGNQSYASPSYPLDAILAQSPVPYPTGQGDQITAYDYVVAQLSPPVGAIEPCTLGGTSYTGVRCEYVNLNLINDWASYTEQVNFLAMQPPPSGVSQTSWDAVTAQLAAEFGDVGAVQQLYVNFNAAFVSLFTENDDLLNQLLVDALGSPSSTTNVKGTAAAIVEGAFYTVLSALGPVESVIANLTETAVNAANAANAANNENLTAPFNGAADTLWTSLSSDFETVLTTTANQETAILSDWGKLQKVAALAHGAGPGSLEWTTETTSNFTTYGGQGYSVSVMQMLLPARYQIGRLTTQGNDSSTTIAGETAPPVYAQYVQFISNQVNATGTAVNGPVYNKYYIADGQGNFPSKAALETDTFGNGASRFDFFLGANGWEVFARARSISISIATG